MHVVTFGEIMGRIYPNGFLRFRQVLPGQINMSFAGAEANVAASIAFWGGTATFVTALPNHTIADSCVAFLRSIGIETKNILRTGNGRLGLYFLESGANQRPSQVIYDRSYSCIAQISANEYPWKTIFKEAEWFHVTGITPALSQEAAEATLQAVKEAKGMGVSVSCDLNFRHKLWRWHPKLSPRESAEKTMRTILPYVDVLIANEEDAAQVLGIQAGDTDVEAGELAVERYPEVAKEVIKQFKNIKRVGITLRESISASHNNWGAMLYDAEKREAFFAPLRNNSYEPYQIRNIVDRVGAGDAFAAGLIYALLTPELAFPQKAISFATAASCLAHSIVGDFNFSTREEIEKLMSGFSTGRVIR